MSIIRFLRLLIRMISYRSTVLFCLSTFVISLSAYVIISRLDILQLVNMAIARSGLIIMQPCSVLLDANGNRLDCGRTKNAAGFVRM